MAAAKDPNPKSKYADGFARPDEIEDEDLEEEPEPSVVSGPPPCPRCGWHNTRLSHTANTLDRLLRTFSLRAYRCRSCGNRFRAMCHIAKP
jgi:hypothetical protein